MVKAKFFASFRSSTKIGNCASHRPRSPPRAGLTSCTALRAMRHTSAWSSAMCVAKRFIRTVSETTTLKQRNKRRRRRSSRETRVGLLQNKTTQDDNKTNAAQHDTTMLKDTLKTRRLRAQNVRTDGKELLMEKTTLGIENKTPSPVRCPHRYSGDGELTVPASSPSSIAS